MPLVASAMKARFKKTIHDGLKRVFSAEASQGTDYLPIADAQWEKVADAISDIAMDIVTEMTTNAQVAPGIVTAGSPTSHVSVSPGKII
jgi:hypothetical protein